MRAANALPAIAPETMFDLTSPMTLRGTVAAITLPVGGYLYVLLDVRAADGTTERWAIQGDRADSLMRLGWRPVQGAPVGRGDAIAVVAYRLKPGADLSLIVHASELELRSHGDAGRLAYGTEITLAEGTKVALNAAK
jgi:hypothetical protein